ncbi:hypothetical protein D3C73_1478340 [compost metagenome]
MQEGLSPVLHLACYDLLKLTGQLLLGDCHQTLGDVTPDRTVLIRCHVTLVTILRDANPKLLSNLVFQLF